MFGMGLTELILISVVGIIALGPEKLPDAMVKMAKMFNKLKSLLNDAKDTLDEQVHLDEITKDMETYKQRLEDTSAEITRMSGAEKAKEEMNKLDNILSNEETELDSVVEDDSKKKKKKRKKKKKNQEKKENSSNENSNEDPNENSIANLNENSIEDKEHKDV